MNKGGLVRLFRNIDSTARAFPGLWQKPCLAPEGGSDNIWREGRKDTAEERIRLTNTCVCSVDGT